MRNQETSFHRAPWRAVALIGLLTLGITGVQQASAGCLQYNGGQIAPAEWIYGSSPGSVRFIKAGFTSVSDEGYAPSFYHAAIVGLWAFKYVSKGNLSTLGIPDGATIDGGNTTWFADGNEVTASGVRDPSTGAVCLGVWKQTGERTYVLNHIGLSWNPLASPPAPGGPAFIKQHVTLSEDGNTYSGTFSIMQLKPDGITPALPAPIVGLILATRVTINTDTQKP
jgi:hypothetical protein